MEDMLKQILSEIGSIKEQVSENTQILKALEHKVDVIKAEQENMKHDMAEIKGDLKAIKDDVSNLNESQASLIEMYGEHEVFIRTLRRKAL